MVLWPKENPTTGIEQFIKITHFRLWPSDLEKIFFLKFKRMRINLNANFAVFSNIT